jgi:hypothetical protein
MSIYEVAIAAWGALLLFGWPIFWIVAHYWHATSKARGEIELKKEMVARGYSAEEIVAVVAAKRGLRPTVADPPPPAKPLAPAKVAAWAEN